MITPDPKYSFRRFISSPESPWAAPISHSFDSALSTRKAPRFIPIWRERILRMDPYASFNSKDEFRVRVISNRDLSLRMAFSSSSLAVAAVMDLFLDQMKKGRLRLSPFESASFLGLEGL